MMKACIRRASPTAMATVRTSSTTDFMADFEPLVRELAISGDPSQESQTAGRPVGEERLADDPRPRDRAPEPAVLRIGTVVAHHVVVTLRDRDRAREVARSVAVARQGIPVFLPDTVADHVAGDDPDVVAWIADHPLDERL